MSKIRTELSSSISSSSSSSRRRNDNNFNSRGVKAEFLRPV